MGVEDRDQNTQEDERIAQFLAEVESAERELSKLGSDIKSMRGKIAQLISCIPRLHPCGVRWQSRLEEAQVLGDELPIIQTDRFRVVNQLASKGRRLIAELGLGQSSEKLSQSLRHLEDLKARYIREMELIRQAFEKIDQQFSELMARRRHYSYRHVQGVVTSPPVEGDQAAYRQDPWG